MRNITNIINKINATTFATNCSIFNERSLPSTNLNNIEIEMLATKIIVISLLITSGQQKLN